MNVNERNVRWQLSWHCVCVAWGLLLISPLHAESQDTLVRQYFEALRNRRLFNVAEGYALHRLGQRKLSRELEWVLTSELARTFAEHAKYTLDEERDELWDKSERLLSRFETLENERSLALLKEIERACMTADRLHFLLRELDVYPYDDLLLERCRTLARETTTDLENVLSRGESHLRRMTSSRPASREQSGSVKPIELTVREFHAAVEKLQYHLALSLNDRANFEQSELRRNNEKDNSTTDGENRTNEKPAAKNDLPLKQDELRTRAAQLLEPISRLDPPSRWTWPARLLTIEMRLARQQQVEFDQLLIPWNGPNIPSDVMAELSVIYARGLIERREYDRVLEKLVAERKSQSVMADELYFCQQQCLFALTLLAKQKNQEAFSRDLLQESDRQAALAQERVGGFWGHRCRVLAERLRREWEYGPTLAQSLLSAQLAHRRSEIDAAISGYERVIALAREEGFDDLGVESSLAAGGLLLRQNDFARAEIILNESWTRHSSHKQAPELHLLLAYALGREYELRATTERREAYTTALREHRQRYADDATFGDATLMLAQLEERRRQSSKALGYYREIGVDHPRRLEAELGIARCYENVLDHLRRQQNAAEQLNRWQQLAVDELKAMVDAFPIANDEWERRQAEIALRLAKIVLNRNPIDFPLADDLLARVISACERSLESLRDTSSDEQPDEISAWRQLLQAARQMRIFSLAGQNEIPRAKALIQSLVKEKPHDGLAIVQGLATIAVDSTPQLHRQLGELQLFAVQALMRDEAAFDDEDRLRLRHGLAEAYAATDQPMKALELYEELFKQYPDDRKLERTVARLLMKCGSHDCLTRASSAWHQIEKRQKEGSPVWFEARYSVALCAYELNKLEECRKLVTVTRLLHPELGGEPWKSRFDELEQRCRRSKK